MKTIVVAFFIVFLLPALQGFAAPEVSARDEQKIIPFNYADGIFQSEELFSSQAAIHVRLDGKPIKLEVRSIFVGTIGEDGAWMAVPHAKKAGRWIKHLPVQEFDLMRDEKEMALTWPKKFDCKALPGGYQECPRWSRIYAKKNARSLCLSAFQLKVQYEEGLPFEIITIDLPCGC